MGKRLGNRAIWTSGCRIQGVAKVVRPCKRRRNSQPLDVTGNDKAIHVSFAREFFKDIATKHFSGQVAEGVTEQATFPMSPNERLLFGMWPKVGKSRRTLYLDVDHVKKDNWLMSSVIHGDECWKPHTKKGIWNPIILINRHRFLCQQNGNHSMSSLPKFVLSALEDLVSISVLKVWQHFTCDECQK